MFVGTLRRRDTERLDQCCQVPEKWNQADHCMEGLSNGDLNETKFGGVAVFLRENQWDLPR